MRFPVVQFCPRNLETHNVVVLPRNVAFINITAFRIREIPKSSSEYQFLCYDSPVCTAGCDCIHSYYTAILEILMNCFKDLCSVTFLIEYYLLIVSDTSFHCVICQLSSGFACKRDLRTFPILSQVHTPGSSQILNKAKPFPRIQIHQHVVLQLPVPSLLSTILDSICKTIQWPQAQEASQ